MKHTKRLSLLIAAFLLMVFNLQKSIAGCSTTVTPKACPGFVTYTQGGWGSKPSGNNPGTYLQNNFATAFPSGLTIGCTNKLIFTSALNVKNFLPSGSSARALNAGTLTNPTSSNYSNVLAGQLVAAMLSVGFDNANSNFAPAAGKLGDLKISSGVFFNLSVNDVITAANKMIGGCPSTYSASDLNNVLTSINQSYDNGIMSGNLLVCPIELTANVRNVSCFGGNNGSISISNVAGGAGAPYTYSWSNGATTANLTNVSAGTYTLTVKDAIGLTKVITITVSQPALLTANSNATAILCNGGNSTVTVSGNGGTPPYSGTGNFTVKAGTYNYTVTDANGCSTTTSVTITEPTLLTANSKSTTIMCNGGTADITITANGGTAPYSGEGTFNVTAGTYNYTVTDANGCSATTSVTITEPTLLTINSNATSILCNGGTADISIAGNGGTAPYSGEGIFTVTAGTYNYTITDANGCSAETTITVTEPDPLDISSDATLILCNGGTADITITANGGTAPYSGDGIFNVTAGTYNYTVTDANGCSTTTSVTVTEPTLLTANSNATAILCNGGNSTVTVSGNGGTPPYSGTGNFTVKAGTYNYTVIDANGCSATTSVNVTEPTLLQVSGSQTDDNSCNTGICSGSAVVNVIGGTTPYNYQWTNAVSSTDSAKNICYGTTVSVVVTDANGCSSNYQFELTNCTPTECTPLKTFTPGGWGASPNGGNAGSYLHKNFTNAFPKGLTIGSKFTVNFKTAQDVTNYLPAGGNSAVLTTNYVNPTSSGLKNQLVNQLTTAVLTVTFDNYDANFASGNQNIANMYLNFAPFKGVSVSNLLTEANNALGGTGSKYSLSDLSNALARFNLNYDNGTQDNGDLVCFEEDDNTRKINKNSTANSEVALTENTLTSLSIFPNPADDICTINITSLAENKGSIVVYDVNGKQLFEKSVNLSVGQNKVSLDLTGFATNLLILKISNGINIETKKLSLIR